MKNITILKKMLPSKTFQNLFPTYIKLYEMPNKKKNKKLEMKV